MRCIYAGEQEGPDKRVANVLEQRNSVHSRCVTKCHIDTNENLSDTQEVHFHHRNRQEKLAIIESNSSKERFGM